ncbi:MAG: fructose-bisphosphatase class III [Eubacteriales bacterium]|nr:fructose-bisphosphatase class III [Eubacteriales bacterium]
MRYVIGDIHGCHKEFHELLDKLCLSEEDTLYILGDVMDRGPEPLKVLQELMRNPNVIYLLGNHDLAFYLMMKRLAVEVVEENVESQLDADILLDFLQWSMDGGAVSAQQFRHLSKEEREEILSYLEEADLYDVLEDGKKRYILVHGALGNFSEEKSLDEYEISELIEDRMDYSRRYFADPDTYIITGHTPATHISGWKKPEVYQKHGHIAMDTGCVGTGILAAYCIETGEVIYNK